MSFNPVMLQQTAIGDGTSHPSRAEARAFAKFVERRIGVLQRAEKRKTKPGAAFFSQ